MNQELTLTKFQFDEIVYTHSVKSEGFQYYLDASTGDIVMVNEDGKKKGDREFRERIEKGLNDTYFLIPHVSLSEGSSDIYEFTKTVANTEFREKLANVLRGRRNVFRKYKDMLLTNSEESERYYAYVQSKHRERVLKWLESVGVKVTVKS
ncbi:UPF0158 family protein [Paenibacillus marinisediminis]